MSAPTPLASSVAPDAPTYDGSWAAQARVWGILGGVGFAVATLVFLAEAIGLLGEPPAYTATAAGQLQDEGVYWAAVFAWRHATLWNVVLRDSLYTMAFLSLVPIGLALNAVTGGRRASVQLAAAFLGVTSVFGILNAVAFFPNVSFWRNTGWDGVPAAVMVTVGRGTEFADELSSWAGTASHLAGAIALVYLGFACRSEAALPRRLGLLAWTSAILAAATVVLAWLPDTDVAWNVVSLVLGVFALPVLVVALGLHLGRSAERGGAGAGA